MSEQIIQQPHLEMAVILSAVKRAVRKYPEPPQSVYDSKRFFAEEESGGGGNLIQLAFNSAFANGVTSSFSGGTLVDGVNTVFTLPHTPVSGSVLLFVNGQFLTEGQHYTRSTATVTLSFAPTSGEELSCVYAREA